MMNAGSFKKCSVRHNGFLHMTRVQRETAAWDLFSIDIECETTEIIMAEELIILIIIILKKLFQIPGPLVLRYK
jgi:hypothetical protein